MGECKRVFNFEISNPRLLGNMPEILENKNDFASVIILVDL